MIKDCCKYLIYFANSIGVLIGLFVFGYGLLYAKATEALAVLKVVDNPEFGKATAAAHIIIGVSMAMIATISCCLATTPGKGKRFMIAIMIFIVLEIGTATYIMARKDKMAQDVVRGLDKSMKKYSNDSTETKDPTTVIIDTVQEAFNCCGSRGPDDWAKTHPGIYGPKNLPLSCCLISAKRLAEALRNSTEKLICTREKAFKNPCVAPVELTVQVLIHLIIFGITIVTGFQMVTVGISYWISRRPKPIEYPPVMFS